MLLFDLTACVFVCFGERIECLCGVHACVYARVCVFVRLCACMCLCTFYVHVCVCVRFMWMHMYKHMCVCVGDSYTRVCAWVCVCTILTTCDFDVSYMWDPIESFNFFPMESPRAHDLHPGIPQMRASYAWDSAEDIGLVFFFMLKTSKLGFCGHAIIHMQIQTSTGS